MKKNSLVVIFLLITLSELSAQPSQTFKLTISEPEKHLFQVEMICSDFKENELELSLPNWTPGYYQMLNYVQYVYQFKAMNEKGELLPSKKTSSNTWVISKGNNKKVIITYVVKATIPFVAQSLLDGTHGYIMPAGMFMHVKNYLNNPIKLTIHNYPEWSTIATGLEPVYNTPNTFTAPDFDTFYDSPILLGNLERLESFYVRGIPHHFIGYKLGDFDKKQFMVDMQKIVEQASSIINHIPYKHYTFLAIGPVPGGIEHLNSTAFGFSSADFGDRSRLLRMYTFLSHEYFHHYNVKRIRPVELGPFDYDNGSKTTMLWIAEGFTNYYDELIVRRAGLMSEEEYLNNIRQRIQSFENKPGKLFQTAANASYETWSDGPFGRTGDDAYKTISVYEKGSLLGLILDLEIRNQTQNEKSLDDLIRYLYTEYYQRLNRGFSEEEFKEAAEKISGTDLLEFFDYVKTTRLIDYKKYFAFAGLELTEKSVELPDPYIGLTTRVKNDTLLVARVEWQSPAWEVGIRSNHAVISINGIKATGDLLTKELSAGNKLNLTLIQNGVKNEVLIQPAKRKEQQFTLQPVPKPTQLQKAIFKGWLTGSN